MGLTMSYLPEGVNPPGVIPLGVICPGVMLGVWLPGVILGVMAPGVMEGVAPPGVLAMGVSSQRERRLLAPGVGVSCMMSSPIVRSVLGVSAHPLPWPGVSVIKWKILK